MLVPLLVSAALAADFRVVYVNGSATPYGDTFQGAWHAASIDEEGNVAFFDWVNLYVDLGGTVNRVFRSGDHVPGVGVVVSETMDRAQPIHHGKVVFPALVDGVPAILSWESIRGIEVLLRQDTVVGGRPLGWFDSGPLFAENGNVLVEAAGAAILWIPHRGPSAVYVPGAPYGTDGEVLGEVETLSLGNEGIVLTVQLEAADGGSFTPMAMYTAEDDLYPVPMVPADLGPYDRFGPAYASVHGEAYTVGGTVWPASGPPYDAVWSGPLDRTYYTSPTLVERLPYAVGGHELTLARSTHPMDEVTGAPASLPWVVGVAVDETYRQHGLASYGDGDVALFGSPGTSPSDRPDDTIEWIEELAVGGDVVLFSGDCITPQAPMGWCTGLWRWDPFTREVTTVAMTGDLVDLGPPYGTVEVHGVELAESFARGGPRVVNPDGDFVFWASTDQGVMILTTAEARAEPGETIPPDTSPPTSIEPGPPAAEPPAGPMREPDGWGCATGPLTDAAAWVVLAGLAVTRRRARAVLWGIPRAASGSALDRRSVAPTRRSAWVPRDPQASRRMDHTVQPGAPSGGRSVSSPTVSKPKRP